MQEVTTGSIGTWPSLHDVVTYTVCDFAIRLAYKLLQRIATASGVGTLLSLLCLIDLLPLVVVGLPFGFGQSG